jgi:hypothetical protein
MFAYQPEISKESMGLPFQVNERTWTIPSLTSAQTASWRLFRTRNGYWDIYLWTFRAGARADGQSWI